MLNNFVRSNESHTRELLACYKDAIRKYPHELRMNANESKIVALLSDNTVYHIAVQDEIIGWLAYKNIDGVSVLNGMYVKSAFQGTNLSRDLLKYYFRTCRLNDIEHSIMSVPNNAPWSFNFYKKYGYKEVNKNSFMQVAKYLMDHNNTYASVLYKPLND